MAVTINARGTSQSSFKLGKNGPLLKNNGGVIEFRNASDTAFVDIRGSVSSPTNPNSLTTKSYVDSVASGLTVKDSVRAATSTLTDMQDYTYQPSNDDNTTSTPLIWERTGQGAIFDGVTLADGDRVLIKESTDARGHGICTYVADTGGGDSGFRRADDSDNTPENELEGGTFVFVREGATQDSDGFVISSPNNVVVLGTDDITWSQFSGGSSSTGAGDGLTKTSNTLNIGGTSGRIVVNSDSVDLASVIQNFESTGIDDNASGTSITINSSQSVGIKDSSPAFSLSVGGTDGIKIPVGTTAQQPSSPETGLLRYNSTISKLELYDGSFSNVATETFVSNNYQSQDSDLTALANTSTTGLYAVTGTGTSATRSITGTTDEITIINGDGVSGNPTISLASNPVLPGVQAVTLPSGTQAQRPSSPTEGQMRYNTDDNEIEYYNGSWTSISGGTSNTVAFKTQTVSNNSVNNSTSFTERNAFNTSPDINQGGFSVTASNITVPESGLYWCTFTIYFSSNSTRTNVGIRWSINNVGQNEISASNYIRDNSGHNTSSTHLTTIYDLSANDQLSLEFRREASSGTVTLETEGSVSIVKIK